MNSVFHISIACPLAAIVLSSCLGAQNGLAGDDAWKQRFFAEAPRKWLEYIARCDRFQGSGSFSHVDMLAGEKWVVKGAYDFKQNRDCGCALFGGVTEEIAGKSHSLRAVNSRYVFELFGHPWLLSQWEPLSKSECIPDPRASVQVRTREPLQFMYTDHELPKL